MPREFGDGSGILLICVPFMNITRAVSPTKSAKHCSWDSIYEVREAFCVKDRINTQAWYWYTLLLVPDLK